MTYQQTTDPLEVVETARDGEKKVLRVEHPWGQRADYAPQHDVLNADKWAALMEGAKHSRVIEESCVINAAYSCEPDVAVIDLHDSFFSEGGSDE